MYNCKYCKENLTEQSVILTDFFQVYKEGAEVYALCGPCYLKEINRYLTEEKPACSCGAPEVLRFDDDEETISMATEEALLNLICSEAKRQIDSGEKTNEEVQDEDEHTYDSMQYIRWFTDEEMGWE